MIVSVSIVDRHRPPGHRHVGTYTFQIDYPEPEHAGQIEFLATAFPKGSENDNEVKSMVGKLLTRETMPAPLAVVSDGNKIVSTKPLKDLSKRKPH